jgi:hypothetical protein
VSDWKHLYAEVLEIPPPPRLQHRIAELARTAPAPSGARSRWDAARRHRGHLAELAVVVIAIGLLIFAVHAHGRSGSTGSGTARPTHRVAANGISLALPKAFHVIQPASPGAITDPQTLLVVGTRGVHPIQSQCQIASYHVPARGAVVVIIGWHSIADAGGSGGAGISVLQHFTRLQRGILECYPGLAGAVQFQAGGLPYQVNVMAGDHAPTARIAQALAVARSLKVSHTVAVPVSPPARPLHLTLPTGWRSRSFSSGLPWNTHGVGVLIAANRPLPASVTRCEALIPGLAPDQTLVRIYDYGLIPPTKQFHRVNVVRPGAPSPDHQPNGRVGGFSEMRIIYHGHLLMIDTNYGTPHPTAIEQQVGELLLSISAH